MKNEHYGVRWVELLSCGDCMYRIRHWSKRSVIEFLNDRKGLPHCRYCEQLNEILRKETEVRP